MNVFQCPTRGLLQTLPQPRALRVSRTSARRAVIRMARLKWKLKQRATFHTHLSCNNSRKSTQWLSSCYTRTDRRMSRAISARDHQDPRRRLRKEDLEHPCCPWTVLTTGLHNNKAAVLCSCDCTRNALPSSAPRMHLACQSQYSRCPRLWQALVNIPFCVAQHQFL
jgi:hypothetical protein